MKLKVDQLIPMGDQVVLLYQLILPSVALYPVQFKKECGKEY